MRSQLWRSRNRPLYSRKERIEKDWKRVAVENILLIFTSPLYPTITNDPIGLTKVRMKNEVPAEGTQKMV